MPNDELIDQLGRYGAWLEDDQGFDVRPPTGSSAESPGQPEDPDEGSIVELVARRPDRGLMIPIAAALLLVGLIGAGVFMARGGGGATVSLAADPPGPLFVLPEDGAGYSLRSASVETVAEPPSFEELVILGRRDGGRVVDVMSVSVASDRPQTQFDDWVEVETAVGVAERSASDELWTFVTRRTDRWWVTVTSGPGRVDEAVRILEQVAVTSDGMIEIGPDLSDRLIERIAPVDTSELFATYAVVDTPTHEDGIVIETGDATSPLLGAALLQGELIETAVQGLPGWRLTAGTGEGQWNALAWSASPNRIVAVSGTVSVEELTAVAESLRQVDEETWRGATGEVLD